MWRKTKKLISRLTTALMFILLIITLFAVISTQVADEEPNVFGYQLKTVLSGSMEPDIQTGSIILIDPTNGETQFKTGDVITYKSSDEILITHRIHEVQNNAQQYITKGDNNNATDTEPVLAENIVGKYTGFTVPYAGYVAHFANTEQGAVLLLILPGFLLLAYAIIILWHALKQIEPPKDKEQIANDKAVPFPHRGNENG
ncbi:signal peptidase I SipW [Oceanobacillus polygoni]|uniref:Signal peptidase I n=1 Tax=Oceanobacillus polygoni TaxID=1235259 RepID=A0A9X1CFJ9_9BACI|nr:signal peptidase I [Oceanobacillus polygoni]MBP2076797.1 signal peptidase [Oceanobacillus polygoni]